MSGMVGVIANDSGRYSIFTVCLTSLHAPVNTKIQFSLTSDRILGRNKLVTLALEQGAEWLMFLDDDHVFPTTIVARLLSHDVPVVGSLYLQRTKPFLPIAYTAKGDDGRYTPVNLHDHGPDDLVQVAAIGTGGMLIRAEVLAAMQEPWFEHGRASEDMMFCDKVYELGLGPIYCDLGVRMGHLSPSALWPTYLTDTDPPQWAVGWQLADGFSVTVEAVSPEDDTAPQ